MKLLPICFFILIAGMATAQQFGLATYYSDKFVGRPTASGELYNRNQLTAAHKTYDFGTMIRVTREDNGKSVVVRINDRGSFSKGRIVDLSWAAAEKIGLIKDGKARVKVEVIPQGGSAPVQSIAQGRLNTNSAKPRATSTRSTTSMPNVYVDKNVPKNTTQKGAASTTTTKAKSTAKPKSTTAMPNVYVDTDAPASTSKKGSATTKAKSAAPVEFELYKIQLSKPQKKGFGVQIAVYSSYENAMEKVAALEEEWFKDIFIGVIPGKDGKKMYKVVLGQFDTQAKANTYRTALKSKYKLTGFVVDLTTL